MKKLVGFIKIVSIVFLCAVLGLLLFKDDKKFGTENTAIGEVVTETKDLIHQKSDLEKQLKEIEHQYYESLSDRGTQGFIITDISDEFLSNTIIPKFQANKWVANLAITPKQYPGMENCISIESANALLQNGWGLIYYCSEKTDLDEWISNSLNGLMAVNIESPKVLYLSSQMYQDQKDNLKSICDKYGIEILVTYVNDGKYRANDTINDSPWIIHAEGYLSDTYWRRLNTTSAEGDMSCFIIGNNAENAATAYTDEDFSYLVEDIEYFKEDGRFSVAEIYASRKKRLKVIKKREEGLKEIEPETKAKIDQVKSEIDELEQEILRIQGQLKTES